MTIYYAPGLSGIGTRQRALDLVGTAYTPGWCLYFQLHEIFKVPGLNSFDHDGPAGAIDYWDTAVQRGEVVEDANADAIPAGVMLAWDGGDYGHVAYSLGGGEMVTTDFPRRGFVGRAEIYDLGEAWDGMLLAGYILKDGNGFTLVRPEE